MDQQADRQARGPRRHPHAHTRCAGVDGDGSGDGRNADITFRDGRGYSAARILREAGYTGELRAVGQVLIDQLSHMRRCGFDSFAPDKRLDEDDAARAFATWDNVYQRAADRRATIADKRHEA